MSIAPFSYDFSDEFAGLYADIERPVALPGAQLTLTPVDYIAEQPALPVAFPTFNDLRDNYSFPTFDSLAAQLEYPTFDYIMQGHPGFPGGPQKMPAGSGLNLGYEYLGVQWWITSVEGVEDSALWESATVAPAGADGSWSAGVYGRGREITITCALVAETVEELRLAKGVAAAALAVAPHRGWLRYLDRRISVQMDGQVRIKSQGSLGAELMVKLRGIDIGTPGVGVFFEDAAGTTTYNLPWALQDEILLGGVVPSPPSIEVLGPVPAGTTIGVGISDLTLPNGVADGSVLIIDSRRRRVLLDSFPRMSEVALFDWPLFTVGANRIVADTPGGNVPDGLVRISVTALY